MHVSAQKATPFSVGVNYWPRVAGTAMWRSFDSGEISEDFARIAGLGLDGVRFFVRWDDFQPEPDRLDETMLGRLEMFATMAHDAGLRVVPALFCGHSSGANYIPAWVLDPKVATGRFPTFTGDVLSTFGAANIYGEALREPQLLFARTVGERLRAHPAIRAWDIGNAFSRVREPVHAKLSTGGHSSEPAAEREMAAWSRALSKALRESSALPVTAGASFDDLSLDRDVRFGTLYAPLDFASLGGLNVENPFGRHRLDVEATPFFAMLAAAFSSKPVLVSGFGIPTCPPGKFSAFERFPSSNERPDVTISPDDHVFATYPCASEDENAAFAGAVLERLHADGRLGAYWWRWADAQISTDHPSSLDPAPYEAASGLLREDGTEKPVAAALSSFAREKRRVVAANDMPMIAAEYYYRTLPKSGRTLYDAYLRFISERRSHASTRG